MRAKIISNSPSWQAKNTASWRMFWRPEDARGLEDSCLKGIEGNGTRLREQSLIGLSVYKQCTLYLLLEKIGVVYN